MSDFRTWLALLADGAVLDETQSAAAFEQMMAGEATPSQIGAFLMALRLRGESVPEIVGAARTLRTRARTITAPADAVDTCGTGGDGTGTFNISTAAAFVAAGAGVKIAKHGNRSISSRSGSADVLQALGVDIEMVFERVEQAINEIGLGFLMAPRHHAAMRAVASPRAELGIRTLFNILGPLCNPAGVKRQVMGVYAAKWVRPLAEVLLKLGQHACWVVHGDGLDELTTTGTTEIAAVQDGKIVSFTLRPEDAGLPLARLADLQGGSPAENAATLRAILGGAHGPLRDIVLLNAAAALIVGGRAETIRGGVDRAAEAIDSGGAAAVLERLVRFSGSTA